MEAVSSSSSQGSADAPMSRSNSNQLAAQLVDLNEATLQRLFDEIDDNSDEMLDGAEIARVFRKTGMQLEQPQLDAVMAEMDLDTNGKVLSQRISFGAVFCCSAVLLYALSETPSSWLARCPHRHRHTHTHGGCPGVLRRVQCLDEQ